MPEKQHDYDNLGKAVVELVVTDPHSRIDLEYRLHFTAQLCADRLMDYESPGKFVIRRCASGEPVFVVGKCKEMRFFPLDFARAVRAAYIARFPAAKLEILQMVE